MMGKLRVNVKGKNHVLCMISLFSTLYKGNSCFIFIYSSHLSYNISPPPHPSSMLIERQTQFSLTDAKSTKTSYIRDIFFQRLAFCLTLTWGFHKVLKVMAGIRDVTQLAFTSDFHGNKFSLQDQGLVFHSFRKMGKSEND